MCDSYLLTYLLGAEGLAAMCRRFPVGASPTNNSARVDRQLSQTSSAISVAASNRASVVNMPVPPSRASAAAVQGHTAPVTPYPLMSASVTRNVSQSH